jgi:hypothetical protein
MNYIDKAHEELFDEKNINIVKKINKWINDFMECEDMDSWWQDSLKHLIFEIREQSLLTLQEQHKKELKELGDEIAKHIDYQISTEAVNALNYVVVKLNKHINSK